MNEQTKRLADALRQVNEALNTCMDHCYSDGTVHHQSYDSDKIGEVHLLVRRELAAYDAQPDEVAIIHRQTHPEPEGWPDAEMMEQAHEATSAASCMVCGCVAPFGVWNGENPSVGVCVLCKKAVEGYRRACEQRHEAVSESLLMATKIHNMESQADLWRDEFQRIKASAASLPVDQVYINEITALCDRAVSDITQRVPVIQQRDKAENEVARLKAENERLRELALEQQVELARVNPENATLRARIAELEQEITDIQQ